MTSEQQMHTDSGLDSYRRSFIGNLAAAVTGAALGPGLFFTAVAEARPAGAPLSESNRWGMLIDANRCSSGCNACVKACNEENGITEESRPGQSAQWIRKLTARDPETKHEISLPMMCQHCANPPCVDVCPTGASFRRADGIVLVDKHLCIGCRYCMMACPYKARSFIHEALHDQVAYAPRGKGTVESCTMCVQRVDAKGKDAVPACAEACNQEGHEAILFGDLKDPESRLSKRLAELGGKQIRADLGLDTGLRYLGI